MEDLIKKLEPLDKQDNDLSKPPATALPLNPVGVVASKPTTGLDANIDWKSEGETSKELLDAKHILQPYKYTSSLPSKKILSIFVDALNVWFYLPDATVTQVKNIGHLLHTACIMLDDIEDSSPLRRGRDAAHVVCGQAQTINSANYLIIWAIDETRKLGIASCLDDFLREMRNSLIGQSYEFHWRDNGICPSRGEYMEMVEKKTGSLFRFIAKLLTTLDPQNRNLNFNDLSSMLGQYFQIRDDYKNLTDTTYTETKGFCEDLDERKFSYLIQHAWNLPFPSSIRLQELFKKKERNDKDNGMTRGDKEEILAILRKLGSFQEAEEKMGDLLEGIICEVKKVEEATGRENKGLRGLLEKLAGKTLG
ncbi:hypothetical protein H072_11088 [Dactylellina haptotyla CBS 200.50]|uniref:Uncharacterized protein n=1 Tax=Dactylellina haptotyla (strain CBS 200.50) TaxID=1284197 RepID=S8A329_DACHA|nr:hypothetical protein H072_11088 [Dactylellina haptotyla CBS 200.50]